MVLAKWDDHLSVNIVEIDRQHQDLFRMINDFHEAMSIGKGKDVLGTLLEGLLEYAGTHFRTEEKYFEEFQYPDANEHQKEHVEFTLKVTELKDKYDQGVSGLSGEVLWLLADWLRDHIRKADNKYVPLFREMGLK